MIIQYIFELIGTFVFAISGVLAVRDKENDVFGAGFTGFVTAIGGGSLRDILLGSYPLAWIDDIYLVYTIFIGVMVSYLFSTYLMRLRKTLFLFDTLGIALFTILGTEKALSLGVRVEIAAIMGMFSAVMGGVIRDTLTNTTPILFSKEVYASACLFGAIFYLVLNYFGLSRDINLLLSVAIIIAIRLLAVKYKISLPSLK
ncbi:MAG: trimeric intracellular cation channel family protein [Cyclobacteriaceae bacterium]|nr:trimeric intracellular cation channel family protein [Cyclobacteriaceae bacterium]MCH8515909.1 trimeric intracellular cation channel family protein [Cyclobacteriaceae bacterium]